MKFSIRRINEWLMLIIAFVLLDALGLNHLVVPDATLRVQIMTFTNAINIYRGDPLVAFGISNETFFLFSGTLIALFIGPWLLSIGFKKAQEKENKAKPWYWYLGGAICVKAVFIIPLSIIAVYINTVTEKATIDARTEELMRLELTDVGFAVVEYEILNRNIDETFTLEQLDLPELAYDYQIESIHEDTLIVVSDGKKGDDSAITIEVRPYGEKIITFRNE